MVNLCEMRRKVFTAMRTNRANYFVQEGMKNVKRNRLMSVASITTTFATLFILGVFLALTMNVNSWATQIARDCQIQVFINEDATGEQYNGIGQSIMNVEGVSSVEKYTKEQIFAEMKEKLSAKDGESILTGLENDNPYRDSFKVSLTDLTYTEKASKEIANIPGVERVTDFRETAGIIYSISEGIKNFSIWVILILAIISAFIISNSIKISVLSRSSEIHIMKYIGATNWFVRWPFIIEGMLVGLFGAIIAFFVIWLVYWRVTATVKVSFLTLLPFGSMALLMIGAFLVVGIVIGFVGSVFSVRKHLKV